MPINAVLRCFCRDPGASDLAAGVSDWTGKDPLERLNVFPTIQTEIQDKDVLDFGCGHGAQVVACGQLGARSVVGVDLVAEHVAIARQAIERAHLTNRCLAAQAMPEKRTFDVIISQDAMEHYTDPEAVLGIWRRVLRPGGKVYVLFGPPWYAPYGAHMHFFTPLPWVHLMFPERAVLAARRAYRDDGATRYEEVEGGLAKMSLRRFDRVVHQAGFRVAWRRHETVKRLPVGRVPLLRELLTNTVAAVLTAVEPLDPIPHGDL